MEHEASDDCNLWAVSGSPGAPNEDLTDYIKIQYKVEETWNLGDGTESSCSSLRVLSMLKIPWRSFELPL